MYPLFINKEKLRPAIEKCILIAAIIWLARYIGKDIAAEGNVRTRILMLFVPFVLIWIQNLTDREKFRLLLWGLILSPLQFWTRFGIQLNELILFGVVFVKLPLLWQQRQIFRRLAKNLSSLIPYAIFAVSGFISCRKNGELYLWHMVCLVPLAWMYVASIMVDKPEDALKIVKIALLSVIGCLVYIWFGNLAGFKTSIALEQYRSVAESIRIGPFYFIVTPLRLATMAALVIPTAGLLMIRRGEFYGFQVLYACCLILLFCIILKTSGRAAAISALTGLIIVFLFMSRTNFIRIFRILLFIAPISIIIASQLGGVLLPIENIIDFMELGFVKSDAKRISNFYWRINMVVDSFINTIENPLGRGFNYLWIHYRIDECISYSILLNGTGIIGFFSYLLMVGHLFWNFVVTLCHKVSQIQRNYAILGIATLTIALMTAFGSESVIRHHFNTFVLWAILGACYAGTRNLRRRPAQGNRNVNYRNRSPIRM